MSRGPLPTGEAARRNKPKIPTTKLPAAGYDGPVPSSPLPLGEQGSAWWAWAWRTPQAAAWSDGDLYFLAHRAQLEDDVAALDAEDFSVLDEVLATPDEDAGKILGSLINRLKAMATGKASLMSRINDMDDKLGLSPKGTAALRWKVVDEEGEAVGPAAPAAPRGRERIRLVENAAG